MVVSLAAHEKITFSANNGQDKFPNIATLSGISCSLNAHKSCSRVFPDGTFFLHLYYQMGVLPDDPMQHSWPTHQASVLNPSWTGFQWNRSKYNFLFKTQCSCNSPPTGRKDADSLGGCSPPEAVVTHRLSVSLIHPVLFQPCLAP